MNFKGLSMEAPSRFELEIKVLQTSALPLGYSAINILLCFIGAEDEIRTRDVHLGKVTLYHWATPAYIKLYLLLQMVQVKGVDPPRRKALDPKSSASANSATPA